MLKKITVTFIIQDELVDEFNNDILNGDTYQVLSSTEPVEPTKEEAEEAGYEDWEIDGTENPE